MQDKDKSKTELIAELEELRKILKRIPPKEKEFDYKKKRMSELQKHFSHVLEGTGIGISLLNTKLQILTLNDQMRKWFPHVDIDSHPLCFMSFNDPPSDKPCSYCPSVKTLQDGHSHKAITQTPVNGKIINYSVISSPIKDENGEIIAVIETVNDITEEKNAQEKLKASEEKYRALFENMKSGVAVYEVIGDGEDFIFKDFNKSGEVIDNDKKERLIGKSIFDVRPGANEFGLVDVLKRVWNTGKPEHLPIKQYKDNQLSGWYENYVYKLPSGEIVAVFDNNTEQKKAEEAIKENEERFRKIFEQNNFGMAMSDKTFHFFKVNDAFCNMLEYSREELLNLTFKEITHPDHIKKDIENIKELSTGKINSYQTEKRYITKNSKIIWAKLNLSTLHDTNGNFLHYLVIIEDITEKKKAEEALKISEERFRGIIDNTEAGYFFIDKDGIIREVNNAWVKLYRYDSPEEVIGQHFTVIQKLEDIEAAKEFVAGIITNNARYTSGEFSRKCKDGSIGYHSFSARPVYRSGEVIGIEGFIIDTTEKKKIENDLKMTKERYQLMISQSPSVIELYNIDGFQIEVNKAYEELWGFPASRTINKFNVLKSKEVKDTGLIDYVMRAYSGETVKVPVYEFDPRGQTEAQGLGRVRWLNTRIYPLKDSNNQVTNIVITHEDVTDQKHSEEALKISEERFKRLIKSVTDYIYTVKIEDGKPTLTLHSPGCFNVTGYTPEEFEKDKNLWYKIIPEEEVGEVQRKIENIISGDEPKLFFEHRIIHRNGSIRWIRNTQVIQKNNDDKIIAYDGLISDITERKKAEEEIINLNKELEKRVEERTAELSTSNKELEAFSYSVSHDLKSPLRIIMGFSQLLLEEYGENVDERMLGYLGKINASINKMAKLIDDLLNLSRITKSEMHKVVFDLCNMSKSIIENLQNQFPDRDVNYTCPENLNIKADPNLIKIVMKNILENSLKYTSKKEGAAKIELGTIKQKNETVYFIKDNGIGFDMTYVNKLFIPFQRLHAANEYEGTGIGLAIVQRIISKHGGKVWIESDEGEGTTIFFTL